MLYARHISHKLHSGHLCNGLQLSLYSWQTDYRLKKFFHFKLTRYEKMMATSPTITTKIGSIIPSCQSNQTLSMMINYHVAGPLHPSLVFSRLLLRSASTYQIRAFYDSFFTLIHHQVEIVSGFLIISPFFDRDFAGFFKNDFFMMPSCKPITRSHFIRSG